MKRLFVALLIIIALLIAAIYVFIPSEVKVHASLAVAANREALARKFSEKNAWKDWWPGEKAGDSLFLNGLLFQPDVFKTAIVPVSVTGNGLKTSFDLILTENKSDSTILSTDLAMDATNNPLKRVRRYLFAKDIKKSLSEVLAAMQGRFGQISSLYQYDIQKKLVVDSILVFTSTEMKERPTPSSIYSLIDDLKAYIKKNSAVETGFPMLNVSRSDTSSYLVKIAIPVSKRLPDTDKFKYRWMLGGGNILITEVKGGPYEIEKAYQQIRHYIADYRRMTPAIPFESLVTDRRAEPDTNKWVTKIYYPVM